MVFDKNSRKKIAGVYRKIRPYIDNTWSFPALMTFVLLLLTVFQISGSSIGYYHTLFYGDQPDKDLVFNQPTAIRSDEWVVTSQKAIAQKNNDFAPINENVGTGEDATLLADMPHLDWSTFFKPHNFSFLVLPFDNAFAFHWWSFSYLLVLSCYFFVLAIMPGKRLLAALLSLGFLFSPFLHWWYVYGAFASIYFVLFGLTIFIKLMHSRKMLQSILWSAALFYVAAAFILILYPPFQIPCALVGIGFLVGYILNNHRKITRIELRNSLLLTLSAIILAGIVIGLFLYQKREVVNILQNTAYPGHRIVESGGYSKEHLLSSHLSSVFQDRARADAYQRPDPATNAVNQSESSNFIFILPFLFIPLVFLAYKKYLINKAVDYTLLCTGIVLVGFLAWLFIPGLDVFGKVTLLDKVPQSRLLIGFGLLNILSIILFIKLYGEYKKVFSLKSCLAYSGLILVFYLAVNIHIMNQFPGFISYKSVIVFALVFPLITLLFLRKHFIAAATVIALFSFFAVYKINPLYQGTEVLTQTPLSQAIQKTEPTSERRWISEDIILENFATFNGRPSLTGVHVYPQIRLWDSLRQTEKKELYNRYAHVNFTFNRETSYTPPFLRSPGADQFNVKINPCDPFFKTMNVGFLITSAAFKDKEAPCATLTDTITYPKVTFYIYKITF